MRARFPEFSTLGYSAFKHCSRSTCRTVGELERTGNPLDSLPTAGNADCTHKPGIELTLAALTGCKGPQTRLCSSFLAESATGDAPTNIPGKVTGCRTRGTNPLTHHRHQCPAAKWHLASKCHRPQAEADVLPTTVPFGQPHQARLPTSALRVATSGLLLGTSERILSKNSLKKIKISLKNSLRFQLQWRTAHKLTPGIRSLQVDTHLS